MSIESYCYCQTGTPGRFSSSSYYRSCLLETPQDREEGKLVQTLLTLLNDLLPGSLSLVGGSGSHEGNVHVNGMPVCTSSWDLPDAWVTCRQAGFLGVSQVKRYSHFGQVSSLGIMNSVRCTGEELALLDCDRWLLCHPSSNQKIIVKVL